ncbi:MAG TPA: vitamin B12-dependent ribonucleotide reductase, partial [Azospirillaceae bacterium]|nr:vitamin B12-dependent ribonucleotide reductase [Azospirillaceae bacterium]
FRELAISYLGRTDLAHATPDDLVPDTVGSGESQGALPPVAAQVAAETLNAVKRVASTGYVRNNLRVLPGGIGQRAVAAVALASGQATAYAAGPGASVMITTGSGGGSTGSVDTRFERIREARAKGYEGDPCPECGNMTLLRNGTCLKCDTCGSTTGCS